MDDYDDVFRYVYSSCLENRIQIKIGTFEGIKQKPVYEKLLEDPLLRFSGLYSEQCAPLKVEVKVYDKGKLIGLPTTTSFKAFTKRYSWNEWITLPVTFSSLPRTAQLTFTLYDCSGPGRQVVVGGTTISMFCKNGIFRQGMYDLRVWSGVSGDGNMPTTTPGKGKDLKENQMQRLAKLAKKHRNGQIQKIDWLDRLSFREIELINEREKQQTDHLYLMIEFPTVTVDEKPYSIVYFERDGDSYFYNSRPKLVTVPDPEILQENLVEEKHHKLARTVRPSDRDIKPTADIRDKLNVIVNRYPPTQQLTSEEQDLVWKYRFYLHTNKKALIKLLKSMRWDHAGDVKHALGMLQVWTPMDVEDALELLNPTFTHPAVRKYAISRLKQAPDEDLLLYLLQLVQALKYENFEEIFEAYRRITPEREILKSMEDTTGEQSSASESLKSSGTTAEPHLSDLPIITSPAAILSEHHSFSQSASHQSQSVMDNSSSNNDDDVEESFNTAVMPDSPCNLATFLIQRACRNPSLANYLFWYLSIECEDEEGLSARTPQDDVVREMYVTVLKTFLRILSTGPLELKEILNNLKKQQVFIGKLVKVVKAVTKESGNRKKKTEKFQQLLVDADNILRLIPDGSKMNFSHFDPRPLPLDPSVMIKGVVADKVTLFKSALMPAKLTFTTTDNQEYVAIFKHGDDLRQDQLILQMITLMDKLLRRENLDLKLTPYRVLATSKKHGFLQFINSVTVAEVLATEGNIHNFFRKHNACETGPFGIAAEVMDTYVRSCAGYCVITYLLGVGDRHLDNLLLTTSGKLFHIDFGYILGRDPKPMPAPMKLSKEMVEAMGGVSSEYHHEFRKQCYTAFLHLRRHANVVLNLFSLMVDASIPDIALEPDKAVKKVEENLKLTLTDEEAILHLQNLLDLSISAVMPALVEQIHKLAQYWRK